MSPYYPWDAASIARVTQLWGEGWSAGLIAEDMGGGLTRCSVIGKIHRLRLVREYGPTLTKRKGGPRLRVPKPWIRKRPRAALKLLVAPPALQKTLLELGRRECRYPYGDGPFTFCAQRTDEGVSYCPYHHALCNNQIVQPRHTRHSHYRSAA